MHKLAHRLSAPQLPYIHMMESKADYLICDLKPSRRELQSQLPVGISV